MEEYKDINKIIGKNLLVLRKNKKLTQMELADAFNYSDKTISKWECGESLPSIEILYSIAKYYGVSLNDLTNENFKIEELSPSIEQKDKSFPTKLIITLLAVSAVWLLATILFVSLQITLDKSYPLIFFWAVPLSCVVLIIFNSIWGRQYLLPIILSVLIWSLLACIHVQLIQYQIWIIYIVGIPLQVAIILWGALIKGPRHKNKQTKIKKTEKKKISNEENISINLNSSENLNTNEIKKD